MNGTSMLVNWRHERFGVRIDIRPHRGSVRFVNMPTMEEQEMKKIFLMGMVVLVLAASNTFAQMNTGQGGGMMGGGWGWGMNYGWFFIIIIAILVILGIVYIMKRR
jgi:hypothetical protein